MNKFNTEEFHLAERIMGTAFNPGEAAEWIAQYRDQLEADMAENVAFVHDQLQRLRIREVDLLRQVEMLQHKVAGLLSEQEFEKADTIPAPAPYAYYCPAQGE